MKEIKTLTSMRGIFAIWVVFFHLRNWSPLSDVPVAIIDRGYLGIDFFFMLSGFILARAHGAEYELGFEFRTHLRFLLKRLRRLFPLHLTVLSIVCLVQYLSHEPLYWWRDIATEAALLHRWGIIHAPKAALNGPDWSISAEWAANLLFPIFLIVAGIGIKSVVRPAATATVAVVTLGYLYCVRGSLDIADANSFLPVVRCFAEFALGIVLLRFSGRFNPLSSDIAIIVLFLAIFVGLLLRYDLLVVLAMIPLLPAIAGNSGHVERLLAGGIPHRLGVISYSIYLIQLPVILAVDRATASSPWASVFHWFAAPATIVLIASLTYVVIEKPGARLSRVVLIRTRISSS